MLGGAKGRDRKVGALMKRHTVGIVLLVAGCTSPQATTVDASSPGDRSPDGGGAAVEAVDGGAPAIDAPPPSAGDAQLIPILPMDAAQPRDLAAPDLIPVSPDTAPDVGPDVGPDTTPDTAPPAPDTRPAAPPCTAFPTTNLSPNPGFDEGPFGWTITGRGQWDPDRDVEMCTSGSVMLTTGARLATSVCLPLGGVGPGYQLAFEMLGDGRLGSGGCGVRWEDGTEFSDLTATSGTWQHRQSVTTAPAAASCVQIFCVLNAGGAAWFDRVKLVNVH